MRGRLLARTVSVSERPAEKMKCLIEKLFAALILKRSREETHRGGELKSDPSHSLPARLKGSGTPKTSHCNAVDGQERQCFYSPPAPMYPVPMTPTKIIAKVPYVDSLFACSQQTRDSTRIPTSSLSYSQLLKIVWPRTLWKSDAAARWQSSEEYK